MRDINYMISVMQAFADGKDIEVLINDKWYRTQEPGWNWDSLDYRVKPSGKVNK